MATKAELLAKIEKAKANKMMPDALKTQYISKIQKELDALDAKSAPRVGVKPFTPGQGAKTKSNKAGQLLSEYESEVVDQLEEQGEMTRSDAQGMSETKGNTELIVKNYKVDISAAETAKKILSGAGEGKKKSPEFMKHQFGEDFMKSKDKGKLKTYPEKKSGVLEFSKLKKGDFLKKIGSNLELKVIEVGKDYVKLYNDVTDHENSYVDISNFVLSDGTPYPAKKESSKSEKDNTFVVFDSKGKPDSMQVSEDAAKKYISRRPKASQSEMKYKEMASDEAKKLFDKKGVDYDCDELIAKERARKASAKKSAAKSPVKKSGDAIKKTADAIEKKAEDGELTKQQILDLIQKFKREIRRLEKLLKTAK